MEERNKHKIEESKKKAERTLTDTVAGHTVSMRWKNPDHVGVYIFFFSIDGGEEQEIAFDYTVMTDQRTENNSRYIETCIKEKIRSMVLL